ncbi:oligosaccharide flippase family protein [Maribellus comscasis]|uniref:Oligosaccharide flippase family protein n=1 Tax=Maribellus comscasis TaxID=2681766 RepID=A0A6I6JRU0_9BACT|nr:oligosaccharide flippase family protein [Maribellus comscasis]QGY45696.1 oligosaccharide flippase family protein [Maribellus comscasis]
MSINIKRILYEKNIISLITSSIGALLGLISFMLLTRELEQKLFGDWVLYLTLSTFFDLLRFGLTSTALVRFASSEDENKNKTYLGTSYLVGLIVVLVIAAIFVPSHFIIAGFNWKINDGYRLFITFYPILALLNLSWNNSVSYFQARQKFKLILFLRITRSGSFVVFLILNILWLHWGLLEVIIAHLVTNLLPSIVVFVKRWDGLMYIRRATRESTKEMLNFGKYSMGTLVGSSLLKSADTFIIGLSPILGSVGIAQYAIPLKLIELLGIPLRSFTITAYPKMSKSSWKKDFDHVKKIFYGYSSVVTILFIPVAVLCFLFAKPLILFLGGNDYKDSLPLLITIFRVFTLYSVLLPIDRFTGVALDSINRPNLNFRKVVIMAAANIVGDLIAVFIFESLQAVAIVTVLFTLIGIFMGYFYLNKALKLELKSFIAEAKSFFLNLRHQL